MKIISNGAFDSRSGITELRVIVRNEEGEMIGGMDYMFKVLLPKLWKV